MSQEFFPLSPSLWAATAAPAPVTTPLQGDAKADVVIVGAGYCGLSTALHLAERGVRVVVLEARDIGFGGRAERVFVLVAGLVFAPWGGLQWAILFLTALTWWTVGQRIWGVRSQMLDS